MSFTQDELQAFNTILNQRLTAQRREMERALDQRMDIFRREFDQRLSTLQQNLLRHLPQRLSELQGKLRDDLSLQLNRQHEHMMKTLQGDADVDQQAQSQQFEDQIERALAAQLLAIEQLIGQRTAVAEFTTIHSSEAQPDFESIEVQTEIPWEDLVEVVEKAMGQRLAVLDESMQTTMKAMEQFLSEQLRTLREELVHAQEQTFSSNIAYIQEIFASIEQLEHIVESMQVAMNANHTLLSNRLYHHQRLPFERAHPGGRATTFPGSGKRTGITAPLPLLEDQENEQQE
jgi:hypothetical protein